MINSIFTENQGRVQLFTPSDRTTRARLCMHSSHCSIFHPRLSSDGVLHRTGRTQSKRISCAFHVHAANVAGETDVSKIFTRLQNGSDIRGVAVEGIEGQPQTLTPKIAFYIGSGLAKLLAERFNKPVNELRVSIGRDPRISGEAMQIGLTAGLTSQGVKVTQFDLATTPAMFMSCVIGDVKYDGAVMITASHLPYNRQGFKFFDNKAGFEKKEITDLLKRAAQDASEGDLSEDPNFPKDKSQKERNAIDILERSLSIDSSLVKKENFMPVYTGHLRDIIKKGIDCKEDYEKPLKGFKFAVDAGNGGGGFLATDVLAELGADTSGSQFLEPDGMFPNHIPNPEDKEAMEAGANAVTQSNSDLCIVLDTDVDRSGVVANNGEAINSNRYIALMSEITLRKYPGTTIVTDSVTSNGLAAFIKKLGGKHYRYRRGYKNVIGKGVSLNEDGTDCQLMMETSGHGAMKENYYLDDGTYSASQIIIELVRRRREGKGDIAEDLLKELKESLEAHEFRLKLQTFLKPSTFKEDGQKAVAEFKSWVESGAGGAQNWKLEPENHEGWRVAVDEGEGKAGWLLLRSSLHDPLLVLNVESDTQNGSKAIVRSLLPFFKEVIPDISVDVSLLEALQ